MEDIIKRIISIEDKAQSVMLEAHGAEEELDDRVARKSREMKADITRRSKEKISKLKGDIEEEANAKISEIESDMQSQLDGLNEKYSKNRDNWVNSMVKEIIGK